MCLSWIESIVRYETFPTLVVYATNVRFITQTAPCPVRLVFWDQFYHLGCNNGIRIRLVCCPRRKLSQVVLCHKRD
ncbi:hypothetical protein Hanom_Chr00s000386g01641581 [Helianthus anomalus]